MPSNITTTSPHAQHYFKEVEAIKNEKKQSIRDAKLERSNSLSLPENNPHDPQVTNKLTEAGFSLDDQHRLSYSDQYQVPQLATASLSIVRHGKTWGNNQTMRQGVCDQPVNQLNRIGKEQAENVKQGSQPYDVILVSPLGRAQDTTTPLLQSMLSNGYTLNITRESGVIVDGYEDLISKQLESLSGVSPEQTGATQRFVSSNPIPGKAVEVIITNDVREMSFGIKENEHVFGVDCNDLAHCMEYDQNALYKDSQPYLESYGDNLENVREIAAESFGELLIRVNDALEKISDNYEGKNVLISSHGIYTRAMLIAMGSDVIKQADDGHLLIDGPDAGSIPNGKLYPLQVHLEETSGSSLGSTEEEDSSLFSASLLPSGLTDLYGGKAVTKV